MVRDWNEIILDRFLTLYLIKETLRSGWPITGKVKLLKLIYLSEQKMIKDATKGFNYNFYRWEHGPFSTEFLRDYEYLVRNGFLKETDHNIQLTEKGLEFLEDCREIINKNAEILGYIQKVIREFGAYPGKAVKRIVYDIPKIDEEKLISKAEHGEELLRKMDLNQAKKFFLIEDEWLETLAILMDKEFSDSLERSLKDAKEGKIRRYTPLSEKTVQYSS